MEDGQGDMMVWRLIGLAEAFFCVEKRNVKASSVLCRVGRSVKTDPAMSAAIFRLLLIGFQVCARPVSVHEDASVPERFSPTGRGCCSR